MRLGPLGYHDTCSLWLRMRRMAELTPTDVDSGPDAPTRFYQYIPYLRI